MTFRQIIRPGDTDDVPPHDHDATEISGTFNFVRILKALIDGDLNVTGFIRTAKTGNRIEIRPAGDGLVSSMTFFTGDTFSANQPFIETEDQGGGVWALKLVGPVETAGTGAVMLLRSDGTISFFSEGTDPVTIDQEGRATIRSLNLGSATSDTLTIGTGAITTTGSYHRIDTEGGAASDDLDTINGGTEGDLLILQADNPARDITVRHLTGNIDLANGSDFRLILGGDTLTLVRGATNWVETSRSPSSAATAVDDLNEVVTGYTNTAYADLDALTTAAFSRGVSATVNTGTSARVIISATQHKQNTAGNGFVSYRISGATTRAATDAECIRREAAAGGSSATYESIADGLTAGSNTFELQARVSANSGDLIHPSLTVIPL